MGGSNAIYLRNALLPISGESNGCSSCSRSRFPFPPKGDLEPELRIAHGHLRQQSFLRLNLALLGGDGPDQDVEDCFCYDVRNRVSDLLAGRRRNAGDSEHLDDVHEGIGQPGDDRKPASVSRERRDRIPMCGGQLLEASLNPTASSATTYKNGIMAKNHHIHRPLALSWISPGYPRATMTADATPSVQLLLTVSSAGSPITMISSMRRSGTVRIQSTYR